MKGWVEVCQAAFVDECCGRKRVVMGRLSQTAFIVSGKFVWAVLETHFIQHIFFSQIRLSFSIVVLTFCRQV